MSSGSDQGARLTKPPASGGFVASEAERGDIAGAKRRPEPLRAPEELL